MCGGRSCSLVSRGPLELATHANNARTVARQSLSGLLRGKERKGGGDEQRRYLYTRKNSLIRGLDGLAAGVLGSRMPRTALACPLSSAGVPGCGCAGKVGSGYVSRPDNTTLCSSRTGKSAGLWLPEQRIEGLGHGFHAQGTASEGNLGTAAHGGRR